MKPTAEQLKDPKWWDENSPENGTHWVISGRGYFFNIDNCSLWDGKNWVAATLPQPEKMHVRPTHSVDSIDMVKRSKYHHLIAIVDMPDGSKREVWVDVYDVINAWAVNNPAQQHLIKKALQAGERGHKDYAEDMDDIIASAERAKELNAPKR